MKRRATATALLAVLTGFSFATAQQMPLRSPAAIWKMFSDPDSKMVNGFRTGLSGETIDYHSANEYARNALLVRPTDGTRSIAWRTDTIPSAIRERFVTFFWLAGLCASRGVHTFELSINDEPWFTFTSGGDSSREVWTTPGRDESALSFYATDSDRFGDRFGYMFLKLPVSGFTPGVPLTLRVRGEAEGSNTWYMTFQYPLDDRISAEGLPVLVSGKDTVRQIVKISLEHYGGPTVASLYAEPAGRVTQPLTWGLETVYLTVKAVARPTEREVVADIEGRPLTKRAVILKPVTRRELYLLPHSHTDIGYSEYQKDVERDHIRYLREAMAIAARTITYPEAARFKWNIEVLWPLESYFAGATEAENAAFVAAVKNGSIGINALYANELTGLCRPEELVQLTGFARRLSQRYGFAVNTAMITDIPSYTSSTVTALALGGVKYWSSGPNYVPSLPDLGDRIGHALKAWGDKPFYWESMSGQRRVLFWMAGKGYSWFHGWIMGKLKQSNMSAIYKYLDDLDSTGYPYDMVQVRYTVDGDNGPPDPDLPDFVKDWNAAHLSPKFVISTTQGMFEEFERRYGRKLPVRRGDLTPYWEDGAASTAKELAMNRTTAEQLIQAQALYSMLLPNAYSPDSFYSAWRDVILFDEHTWGAWNSISDPDSPSVLAQWQYKQAFALEGRRKAEALLRPFTALEPRDRAGVRALDIVNTNSWTRTDLVIVPKNLNVAGDRVRAGSGAVLPSQRLSTGELAILVRNVPPLGSERIRFERGIPGRPVQNLAMTRSTMSNGTFRLVVDEKSGNVRALDLARDGIEFVDTTHGNGMNGYLYVPGGDPRKAVDDSSVVVSVKEHGPLVCSLEISSVPPGSRSLRREIRMVAGLERVDFTDIIDKLKVREKESVHIEFPFLVPHGIVRLDEGWEHIRPEVDQLPGSCKDFFPVQRWADVSNDRYGLTWTTPDAPLVELGTLTDESLTSDGVRAWRDSVAQGSGVYSYVMNNYWHTNYKADQEGEVTLRYSITPHGEFDAAAAARVGTESSQPLLILMASAHGPLPLFSVEPPEVLVTSLKPADDGKGWMVRLCNASDQVKNCSLRWKGRRVPSFYESSPYEERGKKVSFPLSLPASGVATLRIEIH